MKLVSNKSFLYISFLALLPITVCATEISPIQGNILNESLQVQFTKNTELQSFLDKKVKLLSKEQSFNLSAKDFANWETNFAFENTYSSEIENPLLCEAALLLQKEESNFLKEKNPICDLTRSLNSPGNIKKGALLMLDKQKIDEYISSLSEEVVSAPKNAKVKMTFNKEESVLNTDNENEKKNGKLEIIEPGEVGLELNEEETYNSIIQAFNSPAENLEIQLPTKETAPEISQESLSELKIETQIGHGESNFAGSPKNRIHNIYVAVERFDGLLLAPGEEFSFTTILGPVEKETGYKEELVIKDNKTIPEYGGGVCQVSTTVFRAALNTGLKITERRNHAYPVQYYSPQGTDATIYIPKPDLRFINNTPGYIFFQASVQGRKLSFDIFGESDGRVVEMEGPKVTERTPEGILKVTLKQIVKDQEGNLIFEDTFKSVYDNPDKYHEPEILTKKPDDWSNKQWKVYKKEHNL